MMSLSLVAIIGLLALFGVVALVFGFLLNKRN